MNNKKTFILLSAFVVSLMLIGKTFINSDYTNSTKPEGISEKETKAAPPFELVSNTHKTPPDSGQSNSPKKASLPYKIPDDRNPNIANLAARIEKIRHWTQASEFSDQEIYEAAAQTQLWDFSDSVSPEGLPLDNYEKLDGRQFFSANQARVAVSVPGDILEVSLPDTLDTLELLVESVEVGPNKLPSWKGRVLGSEYSGSFNMTRGHNFVSGHINTNENTYSFELFGDKGWVHESGALFTGELPPVELQGEVNDGQPGHEHTTHIPLHTASGVNPDAARFFE